MRRVVYFFAAAAALSLAPLQAQAQISGVGKAHAETGATISMPPEPAPVAVKIQAKTAAILVADMVGGDCGKRPICTSQMAPRISDLLAKARKAGVYVIYSTPRPGETIVSDLAPKPGDPILLGHAQDRFWNTNLDDLLKAKGIQTLILTGWKVDGSVLYTSVAATERGYTAVIPEDASLAPTDHDIAIGHYQALTQLNGNPSNMPLKKKATTLTRTDLIDFD
jgi:nicotinamidase-related amidase